MGSRDRFDKFTERARKVLHYAQEEAQRFHHNYIGTEHLLLGLLRVEDGVAAEVLENLGVEFMKVRGAVEFIIGRGDRIVLGEIGLTPRAKKVIELAVDEARHMNHHYISTEHLLLGMVREGEGIAAGVLESLGVRLPRVRALTLDILSGKKHIPPDKYSGVIGFDMPGISDVSGISREQPGPLTSESITVLGLAEEEARQYQHNYVGTEHLLLGLLSLEHSLAAQILQHLGVELQVARDAVEFIIGRGDRIVLGEIGLTPRARKVIELASDEARRLNHIDVGTEFLLLGLVREGEGIAAGVLESLGVNLEKVRLETIKVLSQRPGAQDATLLVEEEGEVTEQESYTFATPAEIITPYNFSFSDLTSGTGKFDKFTVDSRQALAFAQEEAQRLQHNYIGTEHLLLGLLRANWAMGAQILHRLGIDLHKVRNAVETIIGRGDAISVLDEMRLTPRARKIIALAIDEASSLGHSTIGTEHILLGIVREGEGIAVGVLESLGTTGEKVRQKTLQQLRGQQNS